jgi:hypothetical protein
VLAGAFAMTGVLLLPGCGGDGVFVSSESGGEKPPPPTVTLSTVQSTIFTPHCALAGGCHAGVDAPYGQDLSEGKAYGNIVSVPSQEVETFLRVSPGDPDNSYLILKVSGDPRIGGDRMPLGGPYLDDAEIQKLRDWIAAGAPNN